MSQQADTIKRVKFGPLTRRKVLNETTGEFAMMLYSMRMNYPRITVYTKSLPKKFGEDFSKDTPIDWNTVIIAPFKMDMFMDFLEDFEEVINSKEPIKLSIECLNTKWENGEKTNNIYTQATVTVGKDDKGIVYIAATEDKKRKVKFELLPDKVWYRKKDKNGDIVTDTGAVSVKYAKAYLKMIRALFSAELQSYGKVVRYEDRKGSGSFKSTNTIDSKKDISIKQEDINEDDLSNLL